MHQITWRTCGCCSSVVITSDFCLSTSDFCLFPSDYFQKGEHMENMWGTQSFILFFCFEKGGYWAFMSFYKLKGSITLTKKIKL